MSEKTTIDDAVNRARAEIIRQAGDLGFVSPRDGDDEIVTYDGAIDLRELVKAILG